MITRQPEGNPILKALNKRVELFGVHWLALLVAVFISLLCFEWYSKLWSFVLLAILVYCLRFINKKEPRFISVFRLWCKCARFAYDAGRARRID